MMSDAEALPVNRRSKQEPPSNGLKGGKQKQTHTVGVGDDYDLQCDEVHVNTTVINIDALTEA